MIDRAQRAAYGEDMSANADGTETYTMTEINLQQLWKNYQDAWADISLEERKRLLHASVNMNVTFTSPVGKGQGYDNLVAHIANFQTQFPGAHFRSNQLFEQNSQLLSAWTMFNQDGSEFLNGHSYARLDDEGHLVHLAGFWKQ